MKWVGLRVSQANPYLQQGYATQTAGELIDYAFRTLRSERIRAETD